MSLLFICWSPPVENSARAVIRAARAIGHRRRGRLLIVLRAGKTPNRDKINGKADREDTDPQRGNRTRGPCQDLVDTQIGVVGVVGAQGAKPPLVAKGES
jgi:hypothetical protein